MEANRRECTRGRGSQEARIDTNEASTAGAQRTAQLPPQRTEGLNWGPHTANVTRQPVQQRTVNQLTTTPSQALSHTSMLYSTAQETLSQLSLATSPRTRAIVELALASVISEWETPGSVRVFPHRDNTESSEHAAQTPPATASATSTTKESPAMPSTSRVMSTLYDSRDLATIPACVREAVLNYRPLPDCTLVPPTSKERSQIFKYGARVKTTIENTPTVCWICLASQACRDAVTVIQLSGGKTSKATLHLSNVHNVISEKTAIEMTRKRSRDDDIARILASALCRDDTKRLALLLETQRIVNNNLPFSFGEYYESRVIKEICTKAEFQATLNSHAITHAIVELYASANREAIGFMRDNRVGPMACFTMVADFWSSKHQGDKYLGLRVYFIDAQFRFTSILLGVRHFRPLYGEREQGIRTPFHRWLLGILADFQLCPADFFGSTSDGGPDVKWMMSEGLKLKWEWCIPHLVNAATKTACGMTQKSKNPDMSELINRISQTIFQVHRNEKMGDLMEQLMLLLGKGNGTKLIAYRPHRFMGLAACIRRILEKWDALRSWFEERIAKALRDGARDIPVDFPLVNDKETLIQILSLLQPIELVSKRSQSEAPNQVDVLLTLYALQMSTLALNTPIVRFNSSQKAPAVIQPTELTPCTKTTRVLLQRAFYKNFFYRYIDKKYLSNGSFIFEMQYLLHPAVKHAEGPMDAIVKAVAVQENMTDSEISQHIVKIRRGVIRRIKDVMKSVADEGPNDSVAGEVGAATSCQSAVADVFSADIMRLFAIQQSPPPAPSTQSILQSRIDSEIDQWFEDRSVLETREGVPESILQFWRRQLESNNYRYLPLAAKVIFAVPSSSAQIERDFGNSGQMVSTLRASTSARNIDMASFLRQNRRFVDVCQCPKIDPKDIENYIPTNVKDNLDPETNNRIEWRAMSEQCFSASLSDSE